jgi:hypothetical protein
MQRRLLTCLLSLFLLLMQHETLRHALDHVGAQLERTEHSMLEQPTGDSCAECGLLAAGAGSIPSALPHAVVDPASWVAIVHRSESIAAVPPSYYRSRAPPFVLQLA